MSPVLLSLILAAVGIGAVHSLAPDHWMPLAAMGRARGWTRRKVVAVSALCGLAHVTVSAILAGIAWAAGVAVVARVGETLQAFAGVLLIGFGVLYALWGLRHGAAHAHGHEHAHYDHVHDPGRIGVGTMLVVYMADPCIALIPLFLAAAPLGAASAAGVVLAYEVATVGTMVLLVVLAHAGARALQWRWLDRWGDGAAGGIIAAVGTVMAVTGL